MKDIQPNKQGKVKKAQKRLRRHQTDLGNADQLTAGQRDLLFVSVLQDLIRIELFRLGRLEDIE
jgi:hypothetical protein